MPLPEFAEAAIQSTQNYKRWIDEYNKLHPNAPKGFAEDIVVEVQESLNSDCLELTVKRKKLDLAQVKVKADGVLYETNQIEPVFFNEDNRRLRVKLHDVEPEILFNACKSQDVFVVSDLTFLIRKTEDWFRLYGQRLTIPTSAGEELLQAQLPISLSEEQAAAKDLIMSEPMSYIWGAPGTGKTRAVLASCLYQYIANKRRVLLLAPTNNALDQSLIAVLDVLTAAGVPTSSVVRLGSPTARLLEKYPEICPSAEENDTAEKENRRNLLKSVIPYKVKIANNQELQRNLGILFDELQVKKADEKRMKALKRDLKEQRAALKDCKSRIVDKEKSCSLYSTQIQYLSKSLFRFFYRKKIASLKKILDANIDDLLALESEKDKYEDTIGILEKEIESIDPHGLESCGEKITALIRPVRYLSSWVGSSLMLTYDHAPAFIDSAIRKRISQCQKKIPESLLDASLEDLQEELTAIEAELNNGSNISQGEEDKARYLCAATVDTCISSLTPDLHSFDHVFMDEAGYCSLAKGAILLGYGAPLTLLGDHMQLPPICEINDQVLLKGRSGELKYVSYWAQSVLHIEECFNLSPEDISLKYFSGSDPEFTVLKRVALLKSYRFGSTLASILASEIYTPEFRGNENVSTEIYLLDSPAGRIGGANRTSAAEVYNAVSLAGKLTSQGADFAILTPYRAQLKELAKRLPMLVQKKEDKEDRLLTIHASQGREWDTVILSVVDNSENPPWFMDSTNQKSRGKQIINTAISRARKRLIIIGELDFWIPRGDSQLISKLMLSSEPLSEI